APEFTVFGGGFRDSPEWGSSVILVPWQQYQFTGDDTLLRQYYGAMTNYLAYLQSQSSGYILSYGLGDWYDIGPAAEGYEQLTPLGVTATAYFYQDAQTLAQIAAELGKAGDASKFNLLATNIAAAFNDLFYSAANGYYATGSQTAQSMPLELGIVNPTNQASVLANLVASVNSQGSTAGEIGHRYLLRALTDAGRPDVVFNLNNVTNYSPNAGGYGYMLSQGATSATEGWNANPNDSLDHFMWGNIIEWLYHDLAGIQSDPSAPGFKNEIVKPALVGNVAWVDASYNSLFGHITNNWTLTNNLVTINAVIPPGAAGRVYLPTLGTGTNNLLIQESGTTVMQNGIVSGSTAGVTFDDLEGSATQTYAVWNIGSGSYRFSYVIYPAPGGLAATAGNGQVVLNWNAAANVTGYNVKRAPVSGGPYLVVGSGVTATNFTDATVINGSTYYYVVSAVRTNGESFNSLEASATPAQASLVSNSGFETPVVGTYQYNPSGASWTFTPQSGANGSGIAANGSPFISANPNAPQGVQVAVLQGTSRISQTLQGFASGINYTLTFAAAQRNYQQNGGQTWNVTVNGTVVGSFAPPRSATNYTDYTAGFTATAASETLAFVGTDTQGGDNTVFLDNVRIAQILPSAPAGLIATAGNGFVSLNWNGATNATSYNIKRSQTNDGIFANVAGSTAATNYTDTDVANWMTYYYVVSGINGSGAGSNTAPVFATPGSQELSGVIIGSDGSYNNLGNTITNAFDGNVNTFYHGADATGDWVGLDFGNGISNVISEIYYCPRSGYPNRMTNGLFQAANTDDFTGAVNLYAIIALPTQGVLTEQAIASTNAFRYVRYLGPA
ncbi:MAG TPA: alpha-L-rhamnosidase C-terminal domain-containing protein, partial [Candidatus Acidoferrum sp.]|nr:alpha-L-rhamnosidase C-terminal domain-containing protein [Candidatus Acidoferrum sp.]